MVLVFVTVYSRAQSNPKSYVARYTSKELLMDGEMEDIWDSASWTDVFIDIEGVRLPTYNTRMKMLWDSTYLYFYASMEEPHVWGDIMDRDAIIFYNNDFEIFIDPDGDTHSYMEFEVNALNTVWDLILTKPYRNGAKTIDNWDIKGLKSAVKVNGTLNNPKDIDKGWNVEVAMPWKSLLEVVHGSLPVNQYWRINFSRVNWDYDLQDGLYTRKRDTEGKYLPEYNWVWSPQGVINMHEPEHWGFVYFAKEEENFEPSYDELLRVKLYEVYRSLHERKDTLEDGSYFAISFRGSEVPVEFERHISGWNIKVQSPDTGKSIIIKEDGESLIIN